MTKKLFATQIYHQSRVIKPSQIETLLTDCASLKLEDKVGHRWCEQNYPFGYTSYGSMDKLHRMLSSFADLEKKLYPHLKRYVKQLNYEISPQKIKMTECWVNMMPESAAHSFHIHPNSFISGTVYLQMPRGSSGIKFQDPRSNHFMATPRLKENTEAAQKRHYQVNARAGDVVFFESWLSHEVPAQKVKSERISVSFNYQWCP